MKSRLYSWKKRGLLSHIRRGVYLPANIQNKYQIACNSVDNGCLAYHSALEFYMLQTQEFNWLYVHSSTPFRSFEYLNQRLYTNHWLQKKIPAILSRLHRSAKP